MYDQMGENPKFDKFLSGSGHKVSNTKMIYTFLCSFDKVASIVLAAGNCGLTLSFVEREQESEMDGKRRYPTFISTGKI